MRAPSVDPITLDIIENALKNIRYEMDAVVYLTAMSPIIREQHDEFPLVTDPSGKMVVGQFGSYVGEFLARYPGTIEPGDVFLQNDPYLCGGAISHINDWMVLLPIFYREEELVGWASMFGHQLDCGGPIPGSLPVQATTIFGEGIRIPPFKLYRRGELNEEALGIILHNVRQPEFNRSDLMGLVAGCRTAEKRVLELCDRFGKETYLAALELLFERTRRAMAHLIRENIPEERLSFEDYIDDDGLGHGPFKIKLTMWREGERAIFDWTGTDAQAPGPVNIYLNERMFKLLVGVYLIMVHDPQILFNDGYQELMEVILPEGSLLKPRFPAALGNRTHALARIFDVLCGCLGQRAPQFSTAAGFSTSPHLIYSGYDADGRWFQLLEICYGGIPGRPVGDGIDGHSMWPLTKNIPTEYLETYYPVRIESLGCLPDTGGAGKHRGGNGVEKVYHFLAPGEVSIHDDRWLTYPWGILGGKPGARSSKLLRRRDGREEVLGSKLDNVRVEAGDTLFYRTWGGGGWDDPLERPFEEVRRDVARGLLSAKKAREEYGVILDPTTLAVNEVASAQQRAQLRSGRGESQTFDFGPPLAELLRNCREETGLEPPARFAPDQVVNTVSVSSSRSGSSREVRRSPGPYSPCSVYSPPVRL